jgi:hypothetical protein
MPVSRREGLQTHDGRTPRASQAVATRLVLNYNLSILGPLRMQEEIHAVVVGKDWQVIRTYLGAGDDGLA